MHLERHDSLVVASRMPPLVGRDAELDHLARLLSAAEAGEPQLVVVQGPPGIGKTRLVEEFAESTRRRGGRTGIGRCCQESEAPALWPWRAILRDLGASEAVLDEGGAHGQERFARFLAVLEHLRSAPAPSVIVVDDVHMADAASLLLVRFLSRERALRLLLLLTCPGPVPAVPTDVSELLAELGRAALLVPLSGLNEEAVGAYLAASGAPAADSGLVRAVTAVTHGNPLHLRSVGLQSELGAGGLSGGLERAIRGVLERLAEADRHLIAKAALLGVEVSAYEVARMAEAGAAFAAEALARAVGLGLAMALAGDRFRFVHELIREVAASSLPVSDRLAAHARAASLLEGHDPERAVRRARHALAAASRSGEDAERAVAMAREAARTLRAGGGFEGA